MAIVTTLNTRRHAKLEEAALLVVGRTRSSRHARSLFKRSNDEADRREDYSGGTRSYRCYRIYPPWNTDEGESGCREEAGAMVGYCFTRGIKECSTPLLRARCHTTCRDSVDAIADDFTTRRYSNRLTTTK